MTPEEVEAARIRLDTVEYVNVGELYLDAVGILAEYDKMKAIAWDRTVETDKLKDEIAERGEVVQTAAKAIDQALAELDIPAFYGVGSAWEALLEARDKLEEYL